MPSIVRPAKSYSHITKQERVLLRMLGEELKQPLVAIAQKAEQTGEDVVAVQARSALRTIDSVLLYERLAAGQLELRLEPVHVGSAMHDMNRQLAQMSRTYMCDIVLDVQPGLEPVDIDRRVLQSSLNGLCQSFMRVVSHPSSIVCRAHRTSDGIRVSFLSQNVELHELSFRSNVSSSQPIKSFQGAATDIIMSQRMLGLVGSRVSHARFGELKGYGVTLAPSKQLLLM